MHVPDPLPERECGSSQARRLAVLGSTGSIGTQTLNIVRLFPDRLKVSALTANRNGDLLVRQACEFRPECVVIGDATQYALVRDRLKGSGIRVLQGRDGLFEAATLPGMHTVVAAIVGFAGLEPVLAAIRAGKRIALANKETLVVAGALVYELLRRHEAALIPVDSEHSAIFQCLVGEPTESVEKLILTASGGPFRTRAAASFDRVTRSEALRHPNWSMGAKITIDSATMMNKGLEVIEAHWIFGLDAERIDVLVHPQSIIHSMVAFKDGSTKAQLGCPDMKVPIQYALSCPERWNAPHTRVNWAGLGHLDFEPPDFSKFPCLRLAYEALATGGTAPAVLNAANEQAVALFLEERIAFTDIARLVEETMEALPSAKEDSLEALVDVDHRARRFVTELSRAAAN